MISLDPWVSPPRQPELEPNDIHVWRVSLRAASIHAKSLFELLTPDEVDRALRFHFQRDRDRFVIVRGVLRILLSIYIRIPPEQIRLQYSTYGRPSLAPDQSDTLLDFNVSHSQELALLAFSQGQAVGIDLEYVRQDIVHEQIAEHFFSAQEVASLRALPGDLQAAAFFNCWTRKEAFIKATGEGLSRPLDQFSMSLVPDEAARLLAIQGQPEEVPKWFIQSLEPGSGYAAALVAQRPVEHIHHWDYSLS
jgi:4'-phosphopantetheinyl transferase